MIRMNNTLRKKLNLIESLCSKTTDELSMYFINTTGYTEYMHKLYKYYITISHKENTQFMIDYSEINNDIIDCLLVYENLILHKQMCDIDAKKNRK